MHPLFLTIIRRPDLVINHLSAYASLLVQEANQASQSLVNRVLISLIAVLSMAICVVLSGTALMLGVLQNQFHWVLVAVPGAMALCALCAFAWTKKIIWTSHFNNIKTQLFNDAAALSTATENKVNEA
jgi:polysaccharide pyruvyl transferase WcaK-like protein